MTESHHQSASLYGRRQVVAGVAVASLAAVLGSPRLTRAAAGTLTNVTIKTKVGGKSVAAAFGTPAGTEPHLGIILIHEWWGLNPQIKAVASELADQGYMTLAVDLYDGQVARTPENARKYMGQVDAADATDTLASWVDWLARQPGCNGRIGTVGWCFGGGWSLNAGLSAPVNGVVIYYGNVRRSAARLASLKAPVLGHFATRDGWIDREMVAGFEAEMDAAGKTYTHHWYEADHAFANPTSARYDLADAQIAWQRTLGFFESVL